MARICIISFMCKRTSARYLRFSGDATPYDVSPDYKQQSIIFYLPKWMSYEVSLVAKPTTESDKDQFYSKSI